MQRNCLTSRGDRPPSLPSRSARPQNLTQLNVSLSPSKIYARYQQPKERERERTNLWFYKCLSNISYSSPFQPLFPVSNSLCLFPWATTGPLITLNEVAPRQTERRRRRANLLNVCITRTQLDDCSKLTTLPSRQC